MHDFCVIGGGIVGLASAMALKERFPKRSIVVFEKERDLASHQTGHNSGVIHAGIYYKAGSLKAQLCRAGAREMEAFCDEEGIARERRGKLVVATDEAQLSRLPALRDNASANQIDTQLLDAGALRELEPNVRGLGALLVPDSGITDYRQVAKSMSRRLRVAGVDIIQGVEICYIAENSSSVVLRSTSDEWECRQLVVCAGLQSDRLARLAGLQPGGRVVPFRGEYFDLPPHRSQIVRHMIYPVPEPGLPFLGIHLTPTIAGGMTLGPNAVLGLAREGYPKFSFKLRDALDTLGFRGFRRLAWKYRGPGMTELMNSLFRTRYLESCRTYCPDLQLEDMKPRDAGIRAQFVTDDGELFHDFLFLRTARMLHVCNAPSPAATSSIPIGRRIAMQIAT